MRSLKIPILAAKNAARMGHPRGSSALIHPGRFGPWGGRYVPETLMAACEELEREYEKAKRDPQFKARLSELLTAAFSERTGRSRTKKPGACCRRSPH